MHSGYPVLYCVLHFYFGIFIRFIQYNNFIVIFYFLRQFWRIIFLFVASESLAFYFFYNIAVCFYPNIYLLSYCIKNSSLFSLVYDLIF